MNESEENDQMMSRQDQESFPPASRSDSTKAIGTQIGLYKVISILGEGGFGIVYLAEQKKPVRRKIALKVIKPGMDSKQIIARFEAEQQALALLDHPNIARVFDAGTTEKDRPYFAMEYVKGRSVTEHCDHEKLAIKERLRLFVRICEAIQYAHQKGIVHRDIKPSNILVSMQSGQPIPKIIDFGVVKALSQPLTERTLFTEQGQLIGTPEYMSPEQTEVIAQNVDPRSDVYSLGVVLYELLTGVLPFDPKTLRQAAFSEIQRTIREKEPPRPSTRISTLGDLAVQVAQNRRMDVKRLVRRLHNELEWIPLMAMRKEPARRYKTASELADDIRNYLNGNPLIAGPESTIYRLKKVTKRHRVLVAVIAEVLVVLIAGIVNYTYFARGLRPESQGIEDAAAWPDKEAKKRKEEAEIAKSVLNFLENGLIASAVAVQPGDRELTVQEFLVSAPEKIKDQFKDKPLVEASIRMTLGSILMGIGEFEKAEPLCDKALEIMKNVLGEEDPETLDSMNKLAVLYYERGRYEKAEALYSENLEIEKRVHGEKNPSTLAAMNNLALLYTQWGRYEEAEVLNLKILETVKTLRGERHLSTLQSMDNLIRLYEAWNKPEKATKYRSTLLQKKAVGK